MKFYIASSFDLAQDCQKVADMLSKMGHEIPDIWWNIDAKSVHANDKDDRHFYGDSAIAAIAARHWKTIAETDATILVSDLQGHKPFEMRSFTGANVEVGYAHGIGKPIFTVGWLKRSAMYSPAIKCQTVDDLKEAIQILAKSTR